MRERLGYVNLNGLWIRSEDFAHAAARQAEIAASLEKWGATIEQTLRLVSGVRRQRDRGREQLFGIRDLSAIPAMERMGSSASEAAGVLLIEWLSRLDAYEASQAIARTALVSPHEPVRRVAAEALRSRPFDEYVPVLLGALKTPVTSELKTYVNPRGWVVLDLVFDAEAQDDRRQLVLTQEIGTTKIRRSIHPITGKRTVTSEYRGLDWGDVRVIRNQIRNNERQAVYARLQWNELIRETNRRAEMVLRDVTGTRDHAGPVEWWHWWDDFNEVLVSGTKPLHRVHVEAERQYVTEGSKHVKKQPPLATCSCLVAGTPVWTEEGLVSVEQVQIGDRVLAQNVDSGELSYQPVLATTVRPPARTFQISTEGIQLRATGGHPFWVNGEGWRFARDLKPGMCLHGTDGSQVIKSVEPADEEEAFNLVVADVHTYFIGAGHILSHDNTPRAPTNALVPGLNREP